MYYLSSENKGTDQLCGYREADLRLCFHLCRLLVFPCGGSFIFSKMGFHFWDTGREDSSILPPSILSQCIRKPTICICKTKAQISCAVTAQLISAFVFTTRLVLSLFCLNPKFQAFKPASVTVQPGLCQTWSETQIVGFLTPRLTLLFSPRVLKAHSVFMINKQLES